MNISEFDATLWSNGTTCVYRGDRRDVVAIDFQEKLLALKPEFEGDSWDWVRCENVSDVTYPADCRGAG